MNARAFALAVAEPMRRRAASLAREVMAFTLPQRCPGCGDVASARRVLCARCRERIPRLRTPLCSRCLLEGRIPEGCHRHPGHRVFTPWVYDERAAAVVHALKYGARPVLARPLGRTMARAIPAAWRAADLVLEVPLHPARERERGYNQAAGLADALAHVLGVPRLPRAIVRRRVTTPQARLGEAARRANVEGAFAVTTPSWLAGRRVLLVDDVMTTGATMEAGLGAVRAAGAKVAGVTLAWTP